MRSEHVQLVGKRRPYFVSDAVDVKRYEIGSRGPEG